jgi:Zn-dependent protease with chaperone function
MTTIAASFFDGRTARLHPVTVGIVSGRLTVTGEAVRREEPIEAVDITDAIGRTPRLMRFADGAVCEITEIDAFANLLAEHGIRQSAVSRWERERGWIVASAAGFILALWLAYRFGVPAMATAAADALSPAVLQQIGGGALDLLDRTVFDESALPAGRQQEIAREFRSLELPDLVEPLRPRLTFRRSETLGANALALPSGVVVVTDGLVTLAKDDREILAVLAHEAGHIARRHGVRHLLQSSAITAFIAWYVGDISSIVATAPTLLIDAKYSRDFEREADDYAAAVLRKNGIPLEHLANILQRLETAPREGRTGRSPYPDYLSTHPATEERLRRLRGQ